MNEQEPNMELILEAAKIEMKATVHEWLSGPDATYSKLLAQFFTTGKMPKDAKEQIRQSGESCLEQWKIANAELERLMAENGIKPEPNENPK